MAAASAEVKSKYSGLAGDDRGHCSWFLTRTNKEHQATMEHPFMKTIYAKNFDREAYILHLVSQYHVFSELEAIVTPLRDQQPLCAVYDEALHRAAALAQDLEFWCGQDWRAKAKSPSPETARYLAQLRADASDAWKLLCHHFLQYNAVLSGGQFLGGQVAARANEEAKTGGTGPLGALFYEFPQSCRPTHARVQAYIDAMDKLTISEELRNSMLECMRSVYNTLLSMMDECYKLAPIEGMSFQQSKEAASPSASSSAGEKPKKKKGPPPPPMDPADRAYSAAELLKYDGKTAGQPILMSVLGRVYDVTVGAEFFGPGGPYEMFAGHDGTYNLAVMSLKAKTLDKFDYELDGEDKECLSDWIAYYDNRYGRPVGTLADKKHAVALSDLPKATKIPFDGIGDEEEEAPAAAAPAPQSKL